MRQIPAPRFQNVHGQTRRLNWTKEKIDTRDRRMSVPKGTLPVSVSNTTILGPVEDQGPIGSCVGHGTTGLLESLIRKGGKGRTALSRLYVYYQARVVLERMAPSLDGGCYVRDGMKALQKFGAPLERLWPYDVRKYASRPTAQAHTDAAKHKLVTYQKCQNLDAIKAALSQGYCVVFGFACFESLMGQDVGATGDIPMPQSGEQEIGGHCVLAYGYDDERQVLLIRNSWGTGWGVGGNGTLPYGYWLNGYADDAWFGTRA